MWLKVCQSVELELWLNKQHLLSDGPQETDVHECSCRTALRCERRLCLLSYDRKLKAGSELRQTAFLYILHAEFLH